MRLCVWLKEALPADQDPITAARVAMPAGFGLFKVGGSSALSGSGSAGGRLIPRRSAAQPRGRLATSGKSLGGRVVAR